MYVLLCLSYSKCFIYECFMYMQEAYYGYLFLS